MNSNSATQFVGENRQPTAEAAQSAAKDKKTVEPAAPTREIGGPKGPEPTRYGDWERNGKCVDF